MEIAARLPDLLPERGLWPRERAARDRHRLEWLLAAVAPRREAPAAPAIDTPSRVLSDADAMAFLDIAAEIGCGLDGE